MVVLLFLIAMLATPITSQEDYFSINSNFQVSSGPSFDELAHVRLLKTYLKDGWDKLYIYASPSATPLQQHQAVGFLEGYSTYAEIYAAYRNFADLDFGQPFAPPSIQTFLDNQIEYMDQMVATHKSDNQFWEYVGYYLEQVRYMHAGYMARIKKEGKMELSLDFKQLYYLPSIGDLEDFIHFTPSDIPFVRKSCNAYVRLDGDKLYTTQGTHNRYAFLLRTYKHYNFPRPGIANQWSSFSSRPGDMISKDDFFLLQSGLRILETSLDNYNPDNMKEVKTTTVPSWIRTLVANHLSKSIDQWINYFLMWRSGTHNNQWVLIDPSRVGKESGITVFLEEAFSLYKVIDMTPDLLQNGYIASYNTPITKQLYEKLNYNPAVDPPYPEQLRAIILKRFHPKMIDIEAMKYWLINNDDDPLNKGLAPRYDLLTTTPKPFGLTDCKIASEDTVKQNFFWGISGPSTSNGKFPPFDWSNWKDPTTPRMGLAQRYDFEWVKIFIDLQEEQKGKKSL